MTKRSESGRSAEETARLVGEYERSGLTRREYCLRHGIRLTTFDYYRRRARAQPRKAARLVPVRIMRPEATVTAAGGFTLVLVNGRRIEGNWGFAEEALTRLVRVAERA
jgi:hypothetical protein